MKETMSKLLDSMKAIPPLSLEESDSGVSTVKKFMDTHKEDSKKQIDDYDMDVKEIIKGVDQDFSEDEFFNMDDIFDGFTDDDSDIELQNNLISLGRKYAHEGGSKEVSDIQAQFIPQESELKKMITDLDSDIQSVGRDIANMRVSRSRNFKAMSDLISAQSSLYSTKLSAIKEQNNIKKTVADLKLKMEAKNSAQEDASLSASMAIQQLFSGGPNTVTVNSDEITNSTDSSNSVGSIDDDAQIQQIFGEETPSEGDIYLQYEGRNIQIHCVIDNETGSKRLVAKDDQGVEIPDYPLPSHVEDLSFTVHDDLGTVTDNLGRDYILDYE